MKKFFFQIVLLFFCGNLVAQESRSDSLIAISMEASGSHLAHTYYELALQLLDTLPDSALYFANQAELILIKSDPDRLLPPFLR